MPKRIPVEAKRVQLNCLVAPATMRAIAGMVEAEKISQGVVVDRAVALLAYGEEVEKPPKTIIEVMQGTTERAKRDVNRSSIVPPHPVITLDAVGPRADLGQGKATLETSRASRRPKRFERGIRPKGDGNR